MVDGPQSPARSKPKPRDVHLSDLQLAVMHVLWARPEASTADVAAALAPRRDLAHTTVATLLTRLERRGARAGSSSTARS